MSLPGHDAARGASKERILVKFDNWCEKSAKFRWTTKKGSSEILREEYKIFTRASKNIVGPGHPTASARHWFSVT